MPSAIESAVKISQRISPTEGEKLRRLTEELHAQRSTLDNLYGVELGSRQAVEQRVARLKEEQETLKKRIEMSKDNYRLLSTEPLTWRDERGWPKLVVFDLRSPHWQIARTAWDEDRLHLFRYRFETTKTPNLPPMIWKCYDDVEANLVERAKRINKTTSLTCQFDGLIPPGVKDKISKAKGHGVFQDIYLVAEPHDFQVDKPALVLPQRDPLVVGFDGSQLWLITAFDTTRAEQGMVFSIRDPNTN